MSTNLSFKTCSIFTFSRNISYLPHPKWLCHIAPALCQSDLNTRLTLDISLLEVVAIILAPVIGQATWCQEYSSLYGITHPCSVLEVTEKGKPTSVIHICSIPHFDVSPCMKGNKKVSYSLLVSLRKKISLWNFKVVINSYIYVIKDLSHIYP